MRVGILAPQSPEQIGGGYTFEEEIFERILEHAPASRHQLVNWDKLTKWTWMALGLLGSLER